MVVLHPPASMETELLSIGDCHWETLQFSLQLHLNLLVRMGCIHHDWVVLQ
jgi:hypothetical protein